MQRIIAILLCASLVLQPLAAPLHLVLEEHTHSGLDPEKPVDGHHHHGGHAHTHPHVHTHDAADGDDDQHPSHPAEEHLDQQLDQLPAPPAPNFDFVALPSMSALGTRLIVVVTRSAQLDTPPPRRPPPRGLGHPRAPPAIA